MDINAIHCYLSRSYWAGKLNKRELQAYQASKHGGYILCKVTDTKVALLGKAVHYLKGTITIKK